MNRIRHTSREKATDELVVLLDSKFFKALSEPVRVRILKHLILNGRSDIAAIAKALPQDRSVISRHLQFLHAAGILHCEKITRHVYYEINAPAVLDKLRRIMKKIEECMPDCCPS